MAYFVIIPLGQNKAQKVEICDDSKPNDNVEFIAGKFPIRSDIYSSLELFSRCQKLLFFQYIHFVF